MLQVANPTSPYIPVFAPSVRNVVYDLLTSKHINKPSSSDELAETENYSEFVRTWTYLSMLDIQKTEAQPKFEQTVYANFCDVEEIESIYIGQKQKAYQVYIFLNHSVYDDELMDKLLRKELEIMEKHPDLFLDFNYIPLVLTSGKKIVPPGTVLIFSK